MINANELRLGNYILHKTGVRILPVKCNFQHFDLLSKGMEKDFFPVQLKLEILKKCGFIENEKYYLHPETKEYILTLPIKGNNKNEISAFIAPNNAPYARAGLNELVVSHNIYNLHQLQNLYFALVGKELEITL